MHSSCQTHDHKVECQERNPLTWKCSGDMWICKGMLFLSPSFSLHTWISNNIILTSKVSSHHHKAPCMKALRSSLQCGFGLPETRKGRETSKAIQSSCCMEPVFKCVCFACLWFIWKDSTGHKTDLLKTGSDLWLEQTHAELTQDCSKACQFLQNKQIWTGHYLPTSCVILQHLWNRSLSQPLPKRNSMSRLFPRPQLRKPARFLRSTWHQWQLGLLVMVLIWKWGRVISIEKAYDSTIYKQHQCKVHTWKTTTMNVVWIEKIHMNSSSASFDPYVIQI